MGFECWGLPTKKFMDSFHATFKKEVSYIALSPETGSEDIRRLNKGHFYTNAELILTMDYLQESAIRTILYFSIGLAGEDSMHLHQTACMMKHLQKKYKKIVDTVIVLPIQLEPASPIFENPEKYNIITERKKFSDFYNYHKLPESNPYNYLGYASKTFHKGPVTVREFTKYINDLRCKSFCIIKFKLFKKINVGFMSRLICRLNFKSWNKRGFGIPEVRRVYK